MIKKKKKKELIDKFLIFCIKEMFIKRPHMSYSISRIAKRRKISYGLSGYILTNLYRERFLSRRKYGGITVYFLRKWLRE